MVDELSLIDALKDTSTKEKAFRELINQYKERLYWHIRKIVLSHEDADDVLQNTFIKVFKNIHKFKAESKLYSWLYRIATNEAISLINKRAKENKVDLEVWQTNVASNLITDVNFSGDKIQLILQRAIATLPQKQQLVFNMRYFDELKYQDISQVLETSEGALKASYHHAVKKIEEYIKQHVD